MAIGIPSEFAPGAPPIKIHPLLTGQKALVTEANALRRWRDDASNHCYQDACYGVADHRISLPTARKYKSTMKD